LVNGWPMKSATVIEEVPAVYDPCAPPALCKRATLIFFLSSPSTSSGVPRTSRISLTRRGNDSPASTTPRGLRHLIAGTILLLVWCLAKRLRPTWAQVRASIIIGRIFSFLIGPRATLSLGGAKKVPSGLALSAHCQRAHLGFSLLSRYCWPGGGGA